MSNAVNDKKDIGYEYDERCHLEILAQELRIAYYCRPFQRCKSANETMALRRRLMNDLRTSFSAPLPSRIRYRLKKKPSIYTSKYAYAQFPFLSTLLCFPLCVTFS